MVRSHLNEQNRRDDVIILTTGGTIDKSYNEFDGSLANRETQIKDIILRKLRLPYTYIHVHSLFSKDSLNMTDYDRTYLTKSIEAHMAKNMPIVVIHGTDTMAKSACWVFDRVKEIKVSIVFTGAMRPMGFDDSDAQQNVTEALLASKMLQPGVYICFHNRVFTVPNVRKNLEIGSFESF